MDPIQWIGQLRIRLCNMSAGSPGRGGRLGRPPVAGGAAPYIFKSARRVISTAESGSPWPLAALEAEIKREKM